MDVECINALGCEDCVESEENRVEDGTTVDDYTRFEETYKDVLKMNYKGYLI